MTLQAKLNKLPSYIYCDTCPERHFLTFNKDVAGNYSIGYVDNLGRTVYTGNDFRSLNEALNAMIEALSIAV